MKKISVFILFIAISGKVFAQSLTDFESFRRNMLNDYSAYKQTALSDYQAFRDSINQAYANALKGLWSEENVIEGEPNPEDDVKPIPPIVYEETQIVSPIKEIPIEPITKPIIEEQPNPIAPIEKEPEIDIRTLPKCHFSFYGKNIDISVPDEIHSLKNTNANSVAEYWMDLSETISNQILLDCLAIRKNLHLCDWAYLQFLDTFSKTLLPAKHNEATLFMAYLYVQSGYKIRLATNANKIYMLFSSSSSIYEWPYYDIDGDTFYPYNCNAERLSVSAAAFPNEKSLSLLIHEEPLLGNSQKVKRISRQAKGAGYSISINTELLSFYDSYPTSFVNGNQMTRWALYANTPLSQQTKDSLYPQLRSQIKGQSIIQSLNYLLAFTQFAFEYEYDDVVWGKDRAFFSEETLYYPYADCEDRSILFTRLVRDILNLDCALVFAPGHLFTAVKLPQGITYNGDAIIIEGERFIICDPTYIGANIGIIMPNIDGNKLSAIVLERYF